MSFIMKIIFATEPIKYPLTGIGRYSLELVKRLAVAREIEELKLFHGASFIEQIPLVENKSDTKASNHGRLSAFLRRQTLLMYCRCQCGFHPFFTHFLRNAFGAAGIQFGGVGGFRVG